MLVILLIPLVVFIVDARDVVGVALVCSTFVDNVDAINSVDTAVGTFFFFSLLVFLMVLLILQIPLMLLF